MTHDHIELAKLGLEAIKALGLIIGGGWAVWVFLIQRRFAAMIEFSVDCRVIPYSDKERLIEIELILQNKGLSRQKIRRLTVSLRGLAAGQSLSEWVDHGKRLAFPVSILSEEKLFPTDWEFSFIDPGITQRYQYVARIPTDARFLLVNAEFKYRKGFPHTTSKLIDADPVAAQIGLIPPPELTSTAASG